MSRYLSVILGHHDGIQMPSIKKCLADHINDYLEAAIDVDPEGILDSKFCSIDTAYLEKLGWKPTYDVSLVTIRL